MFSSFDLDPGVALAEGLRAGNAVSSCVVASIGSVHAVVVLGNAVLEIFPELLHLAVGVLVVDWR